VLTDFDGGVRKLLGKPPSKLVAKNMWTALERAPRFFDTLTFLPDAETLWRYCEPHSPTILTGLPRGSWASEQKRGWVARMLGAHVPVITCMSHEKPDWSRLNHVLVDDRAAAEKGWKSRGGIFVRHVSAERSITALRDIGFNS
jgi:hypothetical protein